MTPNSILDWEVLDLSGYPRYPWAELRVIWDLDQKRQAEQKQGEEETASQAS